jgi:hypothetical protein
MSARPGYDAMTWRLVRPFGAHVATPADVEEAVAVFALGDTFNGRVLETTKPQPVIWYGEDEEFAALLVQAEVHESIEGEQMQVAGLLLPNGDTAIALMDDVEAVADTDPVWLALLEAEAEDDGDEDDAEDDAAWADIGLDDDDDELS